MRQGKPNSIVRRAVRGMGDVPPELRERYESGGYGAGNQKASKSLGWMAVLLVGGAVVMAGSRARRNR